MSRLAVASIALAGIGLAAFGVNRVREGRRPPPHLSVSAEQHSADLARHREAQRALGSAPAATAPAVSSSDTRAPNRAPAAVTPDGTTSSASARTAPYWTEFRGPQRDGHYRGRPILTAWPAPGIAPLWKQPVGGGYASFVTANGRAFTIEQRGQQEVVAAYDIRTGRELWAHGWPAAFSEQMGGDGPRATPTWHDGRLYALGATGELRALDDASGQQRWRTNILEDAGASNLSWGMAASPLIVDGKVIVLPGGSGGRSVAAYDLETGRRAWSALDDVQSYSSPMLATIGGVRQILMFTSSRLAGIAPDSGALLWEFSWRGGGDSGINASQPLVVGDRVFISTGYGVGAAMVQVTRDGDRLSVREVWRTNRMKNQFTSSVHHEGYIYDLDEAILACIDAATGELKWKRGRYGYGQVMLASGHLIVLTESGELALVRATPESHVEIARFPAIEGRTWNHPAMADGILLIRNVNEMAAFDLNRR
jgi:outer membrane protein assembly factor BamB